MSRRASNFEHVRDLATRQIELDAAKRALNSDERKHFDWLIESTQKMLAVRELDKQPAPAPRQRKPRQKPAEATA